jgi:hypothetical protein
LPWPRFENEPADIRAFCASVKMPFVSVFAIWMVRLDADQAHGTAGAVWTFPMVEIRRHGDASLHLLDSVEYGNRGLPGEIRRPSR